MDPRVDVRLEPDVLRLLAADKHRACDDFLLAGGCLWDTGGGVFLPGCEL